MFSYYRAAPRTHRTERPKQQKENDTSRETHQQRDKRAERAGGRDIRDPRGDTGLYAPNKHGERKRDGTTFVDDVLNAIFNR